jgi:hypothetical protein
MAPTPAQNLKTLEDLVKSAVALVGQLQLVLDEIHKNPTVPAAVTEEQAAAPLNALALARDSASLIKAHATKISLLIINEPFTATAVTSILKELVSQPLPGLAAAVQLCDPTLYTAFVRRELAWRAKTVLSELAQLLNQIPRDGKIIAQDKQRGFAAAGKGSISTTGMLWSACDDVVNFGNMGVAGFFVKKVEEWRDTLKDVMEELKEWGDEEPDDDDDDDDEDDSDGEHSGDDEENGKASAQDMLDDLMNGQAAIPRADPDGIRPRLEASLKRVRLVTLLFQAITKRRLKKIPSLPPADAASTVPERLDEVAGALHKLTDQFGDLACAFYELDPDEIDAAMDTCFVAAATAGDMLSKTWDGGADEFTQWMEKFKAEVKRD